MGSDREGAVTMYCIRVVVLGLLLTVLISAHSAAAEVEIGGQYRVMANNSNFGWHAATISDTQATDSFFNDRFRTWFEVKTLDGATGYLEIEAGHILWGQQGSEFPKATAFEVRRAYLTYKEDELGEFQIGILPWSDSFGDVLASSDHDFNFGGMSYSKAFGTDGRLKLAALHLRDEAAFAGDASLFTADLELGEQFGLSVYGLTDQGGYSYPVLPSVLGGLFDSATDFWIGVRGEHGSLSWFAIYNGGEIDGDGDGSKDWEHSGFTGKLAFAVPLGLEKKLKLQVLYATGDDDPADSKSGEFRTIAQGIRDNFGAMGYWSMLGLTSPRGPSDVNDLGVSLQNRGLGLLTVQASLDVSLGASSDVYFAAGWLQSAQANANGDSDMGIEMLAEFRHKLGEGMGLEVGAGYMLTGNFYKANPADPAPDDLFEIYARVQLEF